MEEGSTVVRKTQNQTGFHQYSVLVDKTHGFWKMFIGLTIKARAFCPVTSDVFLSFVKRYQLSSPSLSGAIAPSWVIHGTK